MPDYSRLPPEPAAPTVAPPTPSAPAVAPEPEPELDFCPYVAPSLLPDTTHDPGRPASDPSWALDADVIQAHTTRVLEILAETYGVDAGRAMADGTFDQMLQWVDPLATGAEMPEFTYTSERGSDDDLVTGSVGAAPDAVGAEIGASDIDLGRATVGAEVSANVAWDQRQTQLETQGGHFTALGNAIDFLGGPVGSASSTNVFDWSVGVDAEIKGVGLHAGADGTQSDSSTFYAAVSGFPIPGLEPGLDDPLTRVARQAYIEQHPDEFADWMDGRREEVLGGATSLDEFDWTRLGGGEAVSFNDADRLHGEAGAAYAGIGLSLGLQNEDVHEVTMAMSDEGMLDVAVTAMDKGTAEVGLSAFGELEIQGSETSGDVTQLRFSIDTTTATGQQQATMFTTYGLLPGALDTLPADLRAQFEAGVAHDAARADYPFGDALTAPDVDMAALVEQANAQFLDAHREGDLPTADATTYDNMEVGEIEGSGASVDLGGIASLESHMEQILTENRYRNEQGLTDTEYGVSTSIDRGGLDILGWKPFGDGSHVDSFALTNPEFDEDIALYAGITGDYRDHPDVADGQQAAMTVTLTDDQMAGLGEYLETVDATGQALFDESSSEYFFNGDTYPLYGWGLTGPVVRGSDSYVDADGTRRSIAGELDEYSEGTQNNNAVVRAGMTGLQPMVEAQAIEMYREQYGEEPMMVDGHPVADDLMTAMLDTAYQEVDARLAEVQSIEDFQALEDPQLQSAYIQSAAMRLTMEEKNPMLALGMAFELEDTDQRNEVIRDVLAHLPEDGVQYLADLVGEAGASDPALQELLDGAVEEGAVTRR